MAFSPSTGSPTAVTHRRLPQNVACEFLALRSSDDDAQHGVLLQPCLGQAELGTLERKPPLDGQEHFCAAVLSSPVDMTGIFLSLPRDP